MDNEKRVDERFDDFLKKVDTMEKELSDWKDKCLGWEDKLNETIQMVNQLMTNVNASNGFVCDLHNAMASAGMIKSPAEIKKDIKDGNIPEPAKKLIAESQKGTTTISKTFEKEELDDIRERLDIEPEPAPMEEYD